MVRGGDGRRPAAAGCGFPQSGSRLPQSTGAGAPELFPLQIPGRRGMIGGCPPRTKNPAMKRRRKRGRAEWDGVPDNRLDTLCPEDRAVAVVGRLFRERSRLSLHGLARKDGRVNKQHSMCCTSRSDVSL